jgi:hypothetical protein
MIVPARIVVVLLTIRSSVHPIATSLASPHPPQRVTTPLTDSARIQEVRVAPASRQARPLTPAPHAASGAAHYPPALRVGTRQHVGSPTGFIQLPRPVCLDSRAPSANRRPSDVSEPLRYFVRFPPLPPPR